MQDHVPTLETCKKLKEAGFPQETIYHWCRIAGISEWDVLSVTVGALIKMKADYCAAPILTEIKVQLTGDFLTNLDVRSIWDAENSADRAALLYLELQEED